MRRRGLLGVIISLGLLGWGQVVGAQDLPPLQEAAQGQLTPETMAEAVLLGRINQEGINDFTWCSESRAAGVNRQGIWLYDIGDSGHIDFIPPPTPVEGEISTSWTLQTASPNCRWLIGIETGNIAHEDRTRTPLGRFKVWDTHTRQEIVVPEELANFYQYQDYAEKTFEYRFEWAGPTLFVYRTAFSLMGRAYDERDSQLQIWKTEGAQWTLETIIEHPATERTPYTFDFVLPSVDGGQFITVARSFISDQHIITRWDHQTMTPMVLYEEPLIPQTPLTITGLQWATDETSVAIVTMDGALRYALPSGDALPAYTDVCGDLVFLNVMYAQETVICAREIFANGGTGPLTLVRLKPNTNEPDERVALNEKWGWPSQKITPSPWTLFSAYNAGYSVTFLNVETMQERTIKNEDHVTYEFRMKDGETWALLGRERSWSGPLDVHEWNLDTQETSTSIFEPLFVSDVAIAPDSSSILSVTALGVYQWTALDEAARLLDLDVTAPNSLAFGPDQKTLYVSNREAIYVFDWPALTLRQEFKSQLDIYSVRPTPNGEALVVTAEQGQLLLMSTDGTVLTQRTLRSDTTSFPFYYFAITTDNRYLVLNARIFEITDRALLPVELSRPDLPPPVQQVFTMRDKYESLSWYDQDEFAGFAQTLPRFVNTTQGTELVALDHVMEQITVEFSPQTLPLQVMASDRLLIVKTAEALWIYGIPEGREP